MVKDCTNLIVTRTMSKAFGLAGLKVGYMIAGEAVQKDLSSLEVALCTGQRGEGKGKPESIRDGGRGLPQQH